MFIRFIVTGIPSFGPKECAPSAVNTTTSQPVNPRPSVHMLSAAQVAEMSKKAPRIIITMTRLPTGELMSVNKDGSVVRLRQPILTDFQTRAPLQVEVPVHQPPTRVTPELQQPQANLSYDSSIDLPPLPPLPPRIVPSLKSEPVSQLVSRSVPSTQMSNTHTTVQSSLPSAEVPLMMNDRSSSWNSSLIVGGRQFPFRQISNIPPNVPLSQNNNQPSSAVDIDPTLMDNQNAGAPKPVTTMVGAQVTVTSNNAAVAHPITPVTSTLMNVNQTQESNQSSSAGQREARTEVTSQKPPPTLSTIPPSVSGMIRIPQWPSTTAQLSSHGQRDTPTEVTLQKTGVTSARSSGSVWPSKYVGNQAISSKTPLAPVRFFCQRCRINVAGRSEWAKHIESHRK